jgi:hypothetical protein
LGLSLFLALGLAFGGCREQRGTVIFEGGPEGGTFYIFAGGMAELFENTIPGTRIAVQRSGGSVYNLLRIESGSSGMAIVYANDALAGTKGELPNHPRPLSGVLGVARLYGGSAHLAVPKGSPCTSPLQLKGKRVGVGYSGSATALSAEKFFRSLGIWESIIPDFSSYELAATDFKDGRLDALWQMVGFPSLSLTNINRETPIRLLDLGEAVREGGFFQKYPAYTPSIIPAGTYRGLDYPVETFQDQALWVASAAVDEEFVYRALTVLFSEGGRRNLMKVHPIAGDLSLAEGGRIRVLPLHPGAARFWREQEEGPEFVLPGP